MSFEEIIQKIQDYMTQWNINEHTIFLIVIMFFLLIGFFKGFSKGLWKSLFYTLTYPILIIAALLIAPVITDLLKNFDFSFLNIQIEGNLFTTIMELPVLIETAYPEIGQYITGSNLSITIIEVVFASVTVSIFVSLVWTIWLFGWIIQGLLYHLIFKFLIPGVMRKRKLRLLGGVFGVIRAFMTIAVILLPVAATDQYARIAQSDMMDDTTKTILKYSTIYGDSFLGKFMNGLTFGGKSINTLMLDHLTQMDINNGSTTLHQELSVLANTYKVVLENEVITYEGATPTVNSAKLTPAVIDLVVDSLFESKLVGYSIGDVMIIAINGIDAQDTIAISAEDKAQLVTDIKEITDWETEIKHFVTIYKELLDTNGNVVQDFGTILRDSTKMDVIADNIGNSKIFQAAFPIVTGTLLETLKDENGQAFIQLSDTQKQTLLNNVKSITNYKQEILSFVAIYNTIIDETGNLPSDFMALLQDSTKIDTIATSIDTSVLMKTILPIALETVVKDNSGTINFSEFGVNVAALDFQNPDIVWKDEMRAISDIIIQATSFDLNNIEETKVINLVSALKDSTILSSQLPQVTDHLVKTFSSSMDLSLVNDYLDLGLLAGFMEYDIENDTAYFEDQISDVFTLLDAVQSSNFNYQNASTFLPILTLVRDMENDVAALPSISVNRYLNGAVVDTAIVKPTFIKDRALASLVETIASQTFVTAILGSDISNDLDYDSLYTDPDEIARVGNMVTVLFSNVGNIFEGDDATVAANLDTITAPKLIQPVLANVIQSQLNSILGAGRTITVTDTDLVNINWSNEIAAIRFLENQFPASTSFETLNGTTIENLFGSIRDTNIVHKVVVNELNNFMTTLGADYVWSKDTLTTKQSATLGSLLAYKDGTTTTTGDIGVTKTLVNGLAAYDDTTTYDKPLVNAILPAFLERIPSAHTLDKTVFAGDPSYTNASNDLDALVTEIQNFETALATNDPFTINDAANALIATINATGDLASEMILLTDIVIDVPSGSEATFTSQITNTRLVTIIQ